MKLETLRMYELGIDRLSLHLKNGEEKVFPDALANGRANYIIFESLIRDVVGLHKTHVSDHVDDAGRNYEQKAYKDPEIHPRDKDLFRISSSNTFGANNLGPKVNTLVKQGRYKEALAIVTENGYDKNEFYILTNTGGFEPTIPLRFFIVPTEIIMTHLDLVDPRMVSKQKLFRILKTKVVLA